MAPTHMSEKRSGKFTGVNGSKRRVIGRGV
jgi:hypothetical protein